MVSLAPRPTVFILIPVCIHWSLKPVVKRDGPVLFLSLPKHVCNNDATWRVTRAGSGTREQLQGG